MVTKDGKTEEYTAKKDPIEEVKSIMAPFKFVDVKGLPRFCGGLVGYMGYDMVRFIEDLPDDNPEDIDAPDTHLVLTDTILIFDHVDHKIKVVSNAIIDGDPGEEYEKACGKIDKLIDKLKKELTEPALRKAPKTDVEISSNLSKEEFCGIEEKAK